jgi:hypothetical protein
METFRSDVFTDDDGEAFWVEEAGTHHGRRWFRIFAQFRMVMMYGSDLPELISRLQAAHEWHLAQEGE